MVQEFTARRKKSGLPKPQSDDTFGGTLSPKNRMVLAALIYSLNGS
jgi:hypothetical protein